MENEAFDLPEDIKKKLNDTESIRKEIESGKTFEEILQLSNEKMSLFYQLAYKFFERQMYRESADSFYFLTTLNPYVPAYWLGLGMSEQLCNEFDSAISAYGMVHTLDIENPLPYYHTANCYIALSDPNNALKSLELAEFWAKEKPEHSAIASQVQSLKSKIR